MELEARTTVVYLTEQGFQSISSLLELENLVQGKVCQTIERDEFGLWVSPEGEKWRRAIGIPWSFIAAIEMEWEIGRPFELGDTRRRIGF